MSIDRKGIGIFKGGYNAPRRLRDFPDQHPESLKRRGKTSLSLHEFKHIFSVAGQNGNA